MARLWPVGRQPLRHDYALSASKRAGEERDTRAAGKETAPLAVTPSATRKVAGQPTGSERKLHF